MVAMVMKSGLRVVVACVVALSVSAASGVFGQDKPKAGEWPTYGGTLASTRYSPLSQIDAQTFGKLEVAWRFKTDSHGPRPEFNLQATPLVVDGVMYATVGTRRSVVALDPTTGELKWKFALDEGQRAAEAPRVLSGRGLAYWRNGADARVVYVTPGYQLIALDAATGRPVPTFGAKGIVDLRLENDQTIDPVKGDIGLHAAPVIAGDVVIIGSAHSAGVVPKSKTNTKGHVRGYDVKTGKRLWIFHTIPSPGEFGNDTWLNDSWSYTGNAGVWAQMTVDEELGHVYLPIETPTGDLYGGHRPGANLFGDALVALDYKTGKRVWHYQFIHHDLWDWDIPCAPILADLNVNGKVIKAIAQPTKQAWVYVFDRATGRPVWPIEERPVPKGDVPGEWYSPTQPFVTRPPAFDRQGVSENDLIDFTPELRAEALKLVQRYKMGPLYTPPVVSKWEGPLGTLMLPTLTGGANWQGASLDPETNIMYVFSNTSIGSAGLVPPGNRSDMDYVGGTAPNPNPGSTAAVPGGGGELSVQGLPLVKPPYGRITALDLNKGEIAWQIAHGDTPDAIKNNPALKGLTIPRTGRQGRIGTLVTKTLVIAGEGGFATTPNGRGAMLRAYDKATGKEVGAVYMPAPQTGSPMTYEINGTQYLTVAISGPGYSGELLTFRVGK